MYLSAQLLLAATLVACGPADQEIKRLPGWDKPLPSRLWAGYIDAGSDTQDGKNYVMHEHYMLVESEGDPKTDPLVIWTNGGPGAASFFGLFVELGPFILDDASLATKEYNETGVPTLWRNDYSWSKEASILILNSPPPVGFSYCDPAGPSGPGTSCGSWNDTRTAVHNYEFLVNWFKAFPEFRNNDLYITGESYAGIYVPTLAREIVRRGGSDGINLKGWAVGDGCVGTDVLCGSGPGSWKGPHFQVEFLHGHGQVSEDTYKIITNNCTRDELIYGVTEPKCKGAIDRMETEVGGYYAYNLYDDCWYENDFNSVHVADRSYWGPPKLTGASPSDGFSAALNDYPCGGVGALARWMNSSQVKAALHVAPDAFFFSGDNGVGFVYNLTEANLMPFYKEIATSTKYRVLIYNGDTDPGINSFSMQNWTTSLGLRKTQAWRPWTLDGRQRMGGYVTRYEGDFDVLTIRGSGHMVPEFKPRAALEFFTRWLRNEDYKPYKAPSRAGRN